MLFSFEAVAAKNYNENNVFGGFSNAYENYEKKRSFIDITIV